MTTFYNFLIDENISSPIQILGKSHDIFIDKTKGTALDIKSGEMGSASQTTFFMHVLESSSDYEKFLSMSASAKAKYGFAKASGKASFRENIRLNSYELNVVVQVLVKLPPNRIESYTLNNTFRDYIYRRPNL